MANPIQTPPAEIVTPWLTRFAEVARATTALHNFLAQASTANPTEVDRTALIQLEESTRQMLGDLLLAMDTKAYDDLIQALTDKSPWTIHLEQQILNGEGDEAHFLREIEAITATHPQEAAHLRALLKREVTS